jgi:steroid delta-isomerase-like uncharacterized protein
MIAPGVPMSTSRADIEQLFDRRRVLWDARDADGLAATHTPNGRVHSPMFGELAGRDEIAVSYAKLFRTFPDWSFGDQPLVIDGDRVVQLFSATATHSADFMGLPATGRHFKITGARMHVMKDGLIDDEHRLYDFTGLLIQVGVLKGKPAV